MVQPKHNLLGCTQGELAEFSRSLGEAPYRGRQLFDWLYAKGIDRVASMTNLGTTFRERLEESACIRGLTVVAQRHSLLNGTMKFLFALPDGLRIETVLIPPSSAFVSREASGEEEQKRLTLCVSTQVGCPLNCAFCATGTMGFGRNLLPGEIVDQILRVHRITGRKITNVVFMGMGEPLLNYDHVMTAVGIITEGVGIAARRITVSTAGWADRIRRMGDEKRRTKLAISLHSAVDTTRSMLMPVNRKYSLQMLRAAIRHYCAQTKQRVTFEVIFFDGINDTEREIAALVRLAHQFPCTVNVIPYHSIGFTGVTGFPASLRPSLRLEQIVQELRSKHVTVLVRSSAGEDIEAACGQLAVVPGSDGRRGQHTTQSHTHHVSVHSRSTV